MSNFVAVMQFKIIGDVDSIEKLRRPLFVHFTSTDKVYYHGAVTGCAVQRNKQHKHPV